MFQNFNFNEIIVVLLITIRVMAFVFPIPYMDSSVVNAKIKTALSFFIAIIIYPTIRSTIHIDLTNVYSVVSAVFLEMTLGIILFFIVRIVFASIQLAGTMAGNQMGLRVEQLFDPMAETTLNSLGKLMNWVFVMFLVVLNFDHFLFKSLFFSIKAIPIGVFVIHKSVFYWLAAISTVLPLLAIQLVAPIVVIIFLIHSSFGIVSKSVPNINIFFLSIIVTVFIGLAVFLFSLPYFAETVKHSMTMIDSRLLEFLKQIK